MHGAKAAAAAAAAAADRAIPAWTQRGPGAPHHPL